jgi:hypothetical protein
MRGPLGPVIRVSLQAVGRPRRSPGCQGTLGSQIPGSGPSRGAPGIFTGATRSSGTQPWCQAQENSGAGRGTRRGAGGDCPGEDLYARHAATAPPAIAASAVRGRRRRGRRGRLHPHASVRLRRSCPRAARRAVALAAAAGFVRGLATGLAHAAPGGFAVVAVPSARAMIDSVRSQSAAEGLVAGATGPVTTAA